MSSPGFDRYATITMLLQAKRSEVLMGLKELSDHHGVTLHLQRHYSYWPGSYWDRRKHEAPERQSRRHT